MKTGELSRATSVHVETIRFYEREGLLPQPKRLPNGYRIYTGRHVERLTLIRHCRSLDMPLADIRLILRSMAEPSQSCSDINVLIDAQLVRIKAKLKSLRTLERPPIPSSSGLQRRSISPELRRIAGLRSRH